MSDFRDPAGNVGFAIGLLLFNCVLIIPGVVFYYMNQNHPVISKRLPKIVLIQAAFFFIASLIEMTFFDPFFAFYYVNVPCPLYTIVFCAFSTVGSVLTLTRQCVFYSMAKNSTREGWSTSYFSKVWDGIFDVIALIFGSSEYQKYNKRGNALIKSPSINSGSMTDISSYTSSNTRLTLIIAGTFFVGGLASLIELLAIMTPENQFISYPDAVKADCGEEGTVTLTVLGSFMIICCSIMAFRLFSIKDSLGFGYEMFFIAWVPKIWYLVFWLSEEATEIDPMIPRVLFAWCAIMFEMLIPLYFPIAMVYRFNYLQKQFSGISTVDKFIELWKIGTARAAIVKAADLQFCSENTQYLLDLEKLRNLNPNDNQHQMKMIYSRYFMVGAIMELNIQGDLMKEIRKDHGKGDAIAMVNLNKVEELVMQMLIENTIPYAQLNM